MMDAWRFLSDVNLDAWMHDVFEVLSIWSDVNGPEIGWFLLADWLINIATILAGSIQIQTPTKQTTKPGETK